MKAMALARGLAALCILAQGVQLPEDGRRLKSAFGGRAAAPVKATSLLQSLDEFVDADDTTDDETSEIAEASSAAAQDASTESTQEQETAVAVDTASHGAEEATAAQEKSEGADQVSATGKSEGSTKKKKKKAGLFSLVKAQADILDMNKRMDKLKWNLEMSNNKTERCRYKKEHYANRAYEVRAGREFRARAKGKHLVMNETLAKARRAKHNLSTVGLWIITDGAYTKEDHEREKFQRSITRLTKEADNMTKLEEGVAKYTELEQIYSTRALFYADQIAELNATLQAALNLREEAKHNLRPKRRQAKEQPLV